MNLDDLKREVFLHLNDLYMNPISIAAGDAVDKAIDHLYSQGRIVPDGYVAVPLEPTKELISFMKRAENGEYTIRQAWANIVAAAQKGDE